MATEPLFIVNMKNYKDFRWSWKPYLMFMAFFGIRMEVCKSFSRCFYILRCLCTFVPLASIIIINYQRIQKKIKTYNAAIDLYGNMSLEERRHALYSSIFPFLGDIVYLFFSIGPYIVLHIFLINGSLKRMWLILLRIQDSFQLEDRFHLKLRKECYIGLLLTILVRTQLINF